MGNGVSICDSIGLKRQLTVLFVGLDNSGKTCASRALCGETLNDITPTIGFSKYLTRHKGIIVSIYDLGGSSKIREIWKQYFAETHGVVYVIDASCPERLHEAQLNLSALMKNPMLKGKPLLLLANKQDHMEALDEIDVADKLHLESLANACQTPTRIEVCSATAGTGKAIDPIIRVGFQWLVETIIQHYDSIQQRVLEDVAKQTAEEEKGKEARKERIQKLKALQNTLEDLKPEYDTFNSGNPFRPLKEIAEEWNLPGAVLEVAESAAIKSGIFATEAQIDQKDEYLKSPINYSSDHSSTSRGSTSAPGQLPVDRLKQKPSLQNRVGQSASPTTVKKQHSNGKVALPPLKRSITPLKP